jgi:thiamine kinase-like enzyme
MNEEQQQIAAAFARIPALAKANLPDAGVVRLGGLTNLVFRVDIGKNSYCLRIPGEGTAAYINRRTEGINARAAARAGISPKVLFFDERDGLMLSAFLPDTATMTPQLFKTRPGSAARAGAALRRLHTSGAAFDFDFELFSMIDAYLAEIKKLGVSPPAGYADTVGAAREIRAALRRRRLPRAPCHCDPLCENFLDDGERMHIVDWEYSGMNDPMWDLGDLSVEGEFDERRDEEMLCAYFGGDAPPFDRGRMVIYRAMCDLLWTLWGLIQHANGNPAEDFQAYAIGRLTRCQTLMADADFPRHLQAVRAGP